MKTSDGTQIAVVGLAVIEVTIVIALARRVGTS